MFKKVIIILITIFTISCFSGCGSNTIKKSSKLKVSVSFNAMRELVYAIGRDKVSIDVIIPDGTEPHDFELKPRSLAAICDSKVFVYSGFGMEAWADSAIKSANSKTLIAVDASKGFKPIENTDKGEVKEHGQYDPHIWLSLKGAENQSKNIKNALVKADPKNKAYYENNYTDFTKQLESLYNEYNEKFKSVSSKTFVTGHAAFAYLCRDFNLKQNSVEDVFAEGEPSPKKLMELIDYCKKYNIKTIFVEDMVSPKVSQTLANEVGAKIEKIHTMESYEKGKDYITCIKENLELIYNSLKS